MEFEFSLRTVQVGGTNYVALDDIKLGVARFARVARQVGRDTYMIDNLADALDALKTR